MRKCAGEGSEMCGRRYRETIQGSFYTNARSVDKDTKNLESGSGGKEKTARTGLTEKKSAFAGVEVSVGRAALIRRGESFTVSYRLDP